MLIQIANYGFMLVLYLLCFVYLFYPNTEYVCLIFLMILNLFYVLLFYSDVDNLSQIVLHSINIPMKLVIILWWLSLLISNSWFINTYRNLRKPLTMTLPRKVSSFVARSRLGLKEKSDGVVSMSVVVAWPLRKASTPMTFSRNGMFVFTPRMRNSERARCMRSIAIS